jgi:hypothetical protein
MTLRHIRKARIKMMDFKDYNPSIYSASKIWHNVKWREARDVHGFPITARWINAECGTYENPTGAKVFTPAEKTQLWLECEHDVRVADFTAIYGEHRDEMRGGTVEFGMALGFGNPVYVIGKCPFFGANSHSDAAYMHHPLVHRIETDYDSKTESYDWLNGYKLSRIHYLNNYHSPERFFAKTGFLNARSPGRIPRFHQKAITA